MVRGVLTTVLKSATISSINCLFIHEEYDQMGADVSSN